MFLVAHLQHFNNKNTQFISSHELLKTCNTTVLSIDCRSRIVAFCYGLLVVVVVLDNFWINSRESPFLYGVEVERFYNKPFGLCVGTCV